jgi:NadR type nicotinamide-nucleotide adenylyltransferase
MDDLLKVAITGPESTGKSMMSAYLADHYQTVWVPEYARIHLLKLEKQYTYNDVLEIARKQKASEQVMEPLSNKILFSDTEMLVNKIWCEDKFKKCHPWILNQFQKQQYDLYLLMDVDLPWEYDPLREDKDRRNYLFDWYRSELDKRNVRYRIVSGVGEARFVNAVRFVDELLDNRII